MTNNKTVVTYLYVDASNLYGAISDLLPNGSYIDFKDIVSCIEEDFYIHHIKAYGTYLPDEPMSTTTRKRFIGAQNKFFQSIQAVPIVEFHKGYFSGVSGKEKGIDVKLAVDMIKDAYEGSYKCAMIMSGDDDFLYSIQCIRKMNLPVHLTAFASRFPYGIAHNTNQRYVYDFKGHFKNEILPKLKRPPQNIQIKEISAKLRIIKV